VGVYHKEGDCRGSANARHKTGKGQGGVADPVYDWVILALDGIGGGLGSDSASHAGKGTLPIFTRTDNRNGEPRL